MADADLGLARPLWREQALILNFQPARYLHASWLGLLPEGELIGRLREAPRAHPLVSRHLLQAFGLEGRWVEDFSHPWARLALLDGPWLERLLRRLGLALRAGALRQDLGGERMRRLKGTLSQEDWVFLTRETPLLGRIPEFASEPRETDPATRFALIGARYCALHGLGAMETPLVRRLAMKLPRDWAAALDVPRPARPSSLPPLLSKLLRELPAPWIPLFA
ncbi:SctK family type III secretion system sorting platform protein [Imhoffiella purpurea]|uniref:Uncharacterized protein n=1 Tax=Imhoffiella purpurea TaxID=1249627 RepID=W9V7V9_9GAMM|nr:SctK family type III secretion system sorting platform protein [Imhoffiella purpurea]EXJ15668.1 hypothetical protein D779_1175 [Imhoffiella purpurea]